MTIPEPKWNDDWTVDLRVWVQREGQAILGKGRLELLEGIERSRSIRQAALQIGMSYRRAWLLVQSINRAAGETLVVTATGGAHGGGAEITAKGRYAVKVFREFQGRLHRSAAALLTRLVRPADAASVHVAAAVSLEEVVGQLLADYGLRKPTIRVRAIFGASDELADHARAGAPVDLFLSADAHQLERLAADGLIKPKSRRLIARNQLSVICASDRLLTVRGARDLSRPEIRRIAIAGGAAPLGVYTRAFVDRLPNASVIWERALLVDNSRAVLAAVRGGRADAGIVYQSDAFATMGCRLLFPVPGANVVTYVAALTRWGEQIHDAAALLDFLTSAEAASRFRQCGFLPVPRKNG